MKTEILVLSQRVNELLKDNKAILQRLIKITKDVREQKIDAKYRY